VYQPNQQTCFEKGLKNKKISTKHDVVLLQGTTPKTGNNTVAMHTGEPIIVVKGCNKGKNGTFVRNVALSCFVILEGNTHKQWLLRTSSISSIADPPESTPNMHAAVAQACAAPGWTVCRRILFPPSFW
jgi:hypothetical protein